jgi:hypothetical protein
MMAPLHLPGSGIRLGQSGNEHTANSTDTTGFTRFPDGSRTTVGRLQAARRDVILGENYRRFPSPSDWRVAWRLCGFETGRVYDEDGNLRC